MSSEHRRNRIVAVAGAAVLIGAAVALLTSRRTPRPPEAPSAETGRNGAFVLAASPDVQRSSGARWVTARPGDELRPADSIRTGAKATAQISLGSRGTVALAERSELTIREFTAALQRVGIGRGRVGVDLQADDLRILRAEDRSGTIFASATRGRWHVVATQRGLGVAAENGDVRVESGGAAVDVPAGSESAAWRGATPLPPATIPRELFVRLAPGSDKRRPRICAVLQTDVASEVVVDGEPAEVRADGGVTVLLPPRVRRREAQVVVRHATGKVERRRVACGEGGVELEAVEVRPPAR